MEDGRVSSVGTRTVVFTDVTDSTMLRASMGDAAADHLDRTLHRLQEGAVEANSGTIVKTLGDGVMATFDSASQAISAAIEIQARVHDHNQRHPPAIGLRVGIHG
jgi:class 3 adenylate cyclase